MQQIQHYRRWGLSTRSDVEHFKDALEKRKREKESRGKSSATSPARARMPGSGTSRKTSTLAAIEALPGTDQLSQDEHLTCCRAKLFPNQYLALKMAFVSHSLCNGGLSLAEACSLSPLHQKKIEIVWRHMLQSDFIVEGTSPKRAKATA